MHEGLPSLTLAGLGSPRATLEVVFDRPPGDESASEEALSALLRTFVRPGESGGYASGKSTAAKSRLAVIGGPERALRGLLYRLEAEQVDPRAFQILRNMAWKGNEQGPLTRSITVRESRPGELRASEAPPADDDYEDDAYPGRAEPYSFEPVFESGPFKKTRRCLVEARSPLTPEQVLLFDERVRPWMEVLEEGGYCLPIGNPEEAPCVAGPAVQFDDVTVEISVFHFLASEAAWSVLLNILDAISRTRVPLARVTVE